jgi:hypothetical protein
MRSREDWTVVRRVLEAGFILVTNNTADFTGLYEREEMHFGLVCLNIAPILMSLESQKSLFLLALARLGAAEPTNELLDITLAADRSIRAERYRWPPN